MHMLKRFHRFIKKINRKQSFFSSAVDEIPFKRFGNPEEFALAEFFLASERASYITVLHWLMRKGGLKI